MHTRYGRGASFEKVEQMSVKNALLALVGQGPKYGYQLRTEFEERTGGSWPLNIGQVYTTLNRLERDGLVKAMTELPDPEAETSSQVIYRATEAGQAAIAAWFASPVDREAPPRDELAIKVAMAVTLPGVDVPGLVQQQRSATMRSLQDFTRLKRQTGEEDLAWGLVLDRLIFDAEAEVRWLDHCEARVRRAAMQRVRAEGFGAQAQRQAQQRDQDQRDQDQREQDQREQEVGR